MVIAWKGYCLKCELGLTKGLNSKYMHQLVRYILSPIALFAFVAAGTLTTLTGPFGTYLSMTMIERAIYWYTLIGVSIVMSLAIRWYVTIWLKDYGFWHRALTTTTIFTLVFTPCIVVMNMLVLGIQANETMPIWKMYVVVASVPLTVNPMIFLVHKLINAVAREEKARVDIVVAPEPERPRLFERLSDELGEDLLRLSVQDHFVHVHLLGGTEKLRMRFGDAIAEVDCIQGLQVHRSHWVATSAVAEHEFEGGKVILVLRDGSKVPVSRNYRADVEAAGLLADDGDVLSTQQQRPERKSA